MTFLKQNWHKISRISARTRFVVVGIIVGLVMFPIVSLGATFVSALVQGKTIAEAIQILAQQIDILVGRVEVVETKQTKQELWQKKEDACNTVRDFVSSNMPTGYDNFLKSISDRNADIVRLERQINIVCKECSSGDTLCQDFNKNLISGTAMQGCPTAEDVVNYQNYLDGVGPNSVGSGNTGIRPELSRLNQILDRYVFLKQQCYILNAEYENYN